MKPIIQRIILGSFPLFIFLVTFPLFQSCKDDEAEKWVDLRYRVEQDAYTVKADGTEQVSFQVKSTDPWEVFGSNHESWYTISPVTGEAGKTYDVTITCKENTELDDRTDVINIKSDYWTGKQFVLTQKGTAYLNVEGVDMINQEGDSETFDVLSNQKWTAKVTDGDIWLSIKSGTSGEQNGQITVEATPNTGEQRKGEITIYDRHGEIAEIVACIQDGVVLNPETPENGKWFRMYEQAQTLTIHVESNAEWNVSKENEADDVWYNFEETSFNGNGDIVIKVNEHTGTSVRTGIILLTTKADEGATPLVKTIKIKQANPQRAEVHDVNQVLTGAYYGPGDLSVGHYNFYFEPFGSANLNLFIMWKGQADDGGNVELRFHIQGQKTVLSTRPWNGDVYNENSGRAVDTSKPNVLSFEIREAIDVTDPTKSWIYSEWILNDVVIAKATSDGVIDSNGTSDTYKVPFERTKAGTSFEMSASSGSVGFTKWEYIAPLVWGD